MSEGLLADRDAPVIKISNVGPFESSAGEYDRWYDEHPDIFAGEIAALHECLGVSAERSLEIGVGGAGVAAPWIDSREGSCGECSNLFLKTKGERE